MKPQYFRQLIMRHVRQDGMTLEEAAREVLRGLGASPQVIRIVQDVVTTIRYELRENDPLGETSLTKQDVNEQRWYSGVEEGDRFWPAYKEAISSGSLASVVTEIDAASHSIVSRIADPRNPGSKKKGLVLGYVQSGKTANYTAVMSKAADSGYQLVIVLAGMHNNLRRQTQVRLERDLVGPDWFKLTLADSDFVDNENGEALMKRRMHMAAVVKKQRQRLTALRDWLRDIPLELRRTCPILLLDDEADQATPNTKAASDELSKINELIREIWKEIPTGTYIGYTATPFANVFMDPTDDEELYPSNFIMSLPKPDAYFGAEKLFGSSSASDETDPNDGMDVIRFVPEGDAIQLRPPFKKEDRELFRPTIPQSLNDAVIWFIIATAIRRARGQDDQHSSMLVHTTHYTGPHFTIQTAIEKLLEKLTTSVDREERHQFESAWQAEKDRASEVATEDMPSWDAVSALLLPVLASCRVVVDNSESTDRLDYQRKDSDDTDIVETVIAVGGGTLSRGLTLEGLVVSYFLRTSSNYDTLLQMARWFGYRPGYEDLPRIWMPSELKEDFEFLGMVEIEIRQEIDQLIEMGLSPAQLGVRVRSHPGRLGITDRNKLVHAETAKISYTGKRLQTFILDKDLEIIKANQLAAIQLIDAVAEKEDPDAGPSHWLAKNVDASVIAEFFQNYTIHAKQHNMKGEHIARWLESVAADTKWNIAVMGRKNDALSEDLGNLQLGAAGLVPAINRAPLASSKPGVANIKALLSQSDWVADIKDSLITNRTALGTDSYRNIRQRHSGDRGLLTIHVVSGRSVPTRQPKPDALPTREPMNVDQQLIAVGIVFPDQTQIVEELDGTYLVVRTDWDVEEGDQDDFPDERELDDNEDFSWLTA